MTPGLMLALRTINKKRKYCWVQFDPTYAKDWCLDHFAKRTITVAAFLILLGGAWPLVTTVHGQPQTNLEWEIQHLNEKYKALEGLPLAVQLILAHQEVEDRRSDKLENFEGNMVTGFITTIGAIALAMFVWGLNQFGITIGKKRGTA